MEITPNLLLEHSAIHASQSTSPSKSLLLTCRVSIKDLPTSICLFKNNNFLFSLPENHRERIVSKYYPESGDLITTSSNSGLSVIDINKEEIIYSYDDFINDHLYVESERSEVPRIVGITDSSLKFFDLRSRQSIFSVHFPGLKGIKELNIEGKYLCIFILRIQFIYLIRMILLSFLVNLCLKKL